jgi:hypothetical protein
MDRRTVVILIGRKSILLRSGTLTGNKIWGGFEGTVIQHEQISGSALSYRYPDSAPALIPGEIYQWKIYADNDAAADIQGLLSSVRRPDGNISSGAAS